jgi:hypothetical protein
VYKRRVESACTTRLASILLARALKKKFVTKKVGPSCKCVIFVFLSRGIKNHYYLKNKKMLFLDIDLLE